MILLFNVFITDSTGNNFVKFDRGNLKNFSKLNITKYCLSSLSTIPFEKVILNIELDQKIYNQNDYKDLEKFIDETFYSTKVIFSKKRNSYQKDWINDYEKINDSNLIFLLCNHDHIFLNSNTDWFTYINNLPHNPNLTFSTSHWMEAIRWAKSGYIELNEFVPNKQHNGYKINENYVQYESISLDSLNVISNEIYKNWFLEGNWGNFQLPRTDGIGKGSLADIKNFLRLTFHPQNICVPYKEQLRHFDGYMHQNIPNSVCPSILIPDGFFEKEIKLRYGYDDYKDGWFNINPKNSNYRAFDLNGTDDKITLDDIPLFWKNKISDIDINKDVNDEEMVQYRLKSILEMVYFDTRYNPYIDDEVKNKILKEYIKSYKNYTLV